MTIRRRLNLWRVVVLVALTANVIYAAIGAMPAAAISAASLVAMLALLVTTPSDAIVLPRARSEGIIAIGFAIAAAIATRGAINGIVIALAAMAVGIALLAACRLRSISAWWTAVALWQPIVLILIRGSV